MNERTTKIIICFVLLLLISGCTSSRTQNKLADKAGEKLQESAVQQAEAAAEEAQRNIDQERVNFKCIISGAQTIYFLRDKAKIESMGHESWLNDEGYFTKTEINGKYYLVQYPSSESQISYESMQVAYDVSLTNSAYQCELNTVTDQMVALPEIEIISKEEFSDMMMAEWEGYYS